MLKIDICVCTYQRPTMLETLLESLANLEESSEFTTSLIVVDNDKNRSAKPVVDRLRLSLNVPIQYYCESRQNIALARNLAVKMAGGDLIAFIDDDEYPQADWLINLWVAMKGSQADGVLGPVNGQLPSDAPEWVLKGGFFRRGRNIESGVKLRWNQTGTGNCLITRSALLALPGPFDPAYADGGEDIMLFKQLMARGYQFIWDADAAIMETVTSERASASWLLRRAFNEGAVFARIENVSAMPFGARLLFHLRSMAIIVYYVANMPIRALQGSHRLFQCLQGIAIQLGKIFG